MTRFTAEALSSRRKGYKNLPFPFLRLQSGHAFSKRVGNRTEKLPPLKKGDERGI
jgi:hypothetical protein